MQQGWEAGVEAGGEEKEVAGGKGIFGARMGVDEGWGKHKRGERREEEGTGGQGGQAGKDELLLVWTERIWGETKKSVIFVFFDF